jgi:S1-C subfamily serine protease
MTVQGGSVKLYYIIPFIVLAVFTGCGTTIDIPLGYPVTTEELIIENLEQFSADGEYGELVQYISYLNRSTNPVEQPVLDSYFEDGIESLKKSFRDSVEQGNYNDALMYLHSLETLNIKHEPPVTKAELRAANALEYLEQDNIPASMSLIMEMDNLDSLDTDVLLRFGRAAFNIGHVSVFEKVADIIKNREPDIFSRYKELEIEQPTPEKLISGTCTIWVNRGIKIEDGVGLPDRVIGSGFFIDPRGYLITNYHVIASEVDPEYEGYSRLYIRLPGKYDEKIPAKVIGYDRLFDIALLKVPIEPPFVFPFTGKKDLKPGTDILAIGSPVGLDMTITSGIISAVGRRFLQIGDALQVDVPVNPGSSGGPLVTRSGLLVGVIFAGLPQFQGINFAIPGHWINRFIPGMYGEGEVSHPWFGTAVHEEDSGLKVIYVQRNSPAGKGGLKFGDRIISIAGKQVSNILKAQEIIMDLPINSLVKVTWEREGIILHGYFSMENRPYLPLKNALENELITRLFPPLFGFSAEKTGGFLKKEYVIDEIFDGSVADESGLSEGDPLVLREWTYDDEFEAVIIRLFVKKKEAGFMETGIQLAAFLETDIFL